MNEIIAFVTVRLIYVADHLPVGYAFGAGMLATVNPCGFAMLPALIGYFLVRQDAPGAAISPTLVLARGILLALLISAGFLVVFGVVGAIVSVGGQAITGYVPWAAVVIGVGMVFVGASLLLGRTVQLGAAQRWSAPAAAYYRRSLGAAGAPPAVERNLTGLFVFGIAYAVASLRVP